MSPQDQISCNLCCRFPLCMVGAGGLPAKAAERKEVIAGMENEHGTSIIRWERSSRPRWGGSGNKRCRGQGSGRRAGGGFGLGVLDRGVARPCATLSPALF